MKQGAIASLPQTASHIRSERQCTAHEQPIFVIGCQRSGTTLLRAMLNAHPCIAIPYESGRFSKLIDAEDRWNAIWNPEQAQRYLSQFLSNPKVCFWAPDQRLAVEELGAMREIRYADLLRAVFRGYVTQQGKSRWGEKTPGNTFEVPQLAQAFPDAQFVHIVRDGRDVHLSWKNVDWLTSTLVGDAKRWQRMVAAACWAERLGPRRYYLLRYEDLVQSPELILRELCAFLREPYAETMLQFYEQENLVPQERQHVHSLLSGPLDSSRIYRWRQEMPRADVQVFEQLVGQTLLQFRYEVGGFRRMQALAGLWRHRLRSLVWCRGQERCQ